MKEEDARQKWCPMMRYINFRESIVSNRGQYLEGDFPNTMECIASDCMMWVETKGRSYTEDGDEIPTGYCGLAGKP